MEGFRGTIRVGELLLAEGVPKTVFLFHLFFWFPRIKTRLLCLFVLNCFLLLESKVVETMKKDPGRRAAEAALIFLPDLALN